MTGERPPDKLVYNKSLPTSRVCLTVPVRRLLMRALSTVAPLEDLVELQAQNYWVGLAWEKGYHELPYQGWPTDESDALCD